MIITVKHLTINNEILNMCKYITANFIIDQLNIVQKNFH